MMNRNEHSVMDVCKQLVMRMSGSGDDLSENSFVHLTAWLCWRVEDGWQEGRTSMILVDTAIRDMARAVAYKAAVECTLMVGP